MTHEEYDLMNLANNPPPETIWACRKEIPAGLAMLAGAPTAGKTWFALQLALSVASGRPHLGQFETNWGDVLFLALEDSPRRMYDRMLHLGGFEQLRAGAGGKITMRHESPKGQACLDRFEQWAQSRGELARMVLIDTLAYVKFPTDRTLPQYDRDVQSVEPFARWARERGIAVVAMTHTPKMAYSQIVHQIGGTSGLAATADTKMVLQRQNKEENGRLWIAGRDVDQDLRLRFRDARWEYHGDIEPAREANPVRAAIKEVLGSNPAPMTPAQIYESLGRHLNGSTPSEAALRQELRRMHENPDQPVERVGHGLYRLRGGENSVTLSQRRDNVGTPEF